MEVKNTLSITKSISVQGTSMIEENGNKVAVMYLSANITESGATSISQTIMIKNCMLQIRAHVKPIMKNSRQKLTN